MRPFGTHAPLGIAGRIISLCHRLPANALGRRAALWLRRIALITHGPVFDITVDGTKLRLHPANNVADRRVLFTPQLFDPDERRLIAHCLPADGVFVDIGANIGLYTLFALASLNERGRVVAVEPGTRVLERLRTHIQLNEAVSQVQVIEAAVADRTGTGRLRHDQRNLGGASILKGSDGDKSEEVRFLTLLEIINLTGLDRIDVMKIDIEGAEDLALIPFFTAAPDTLYPRALIIERSEKTWQGDLIGHLARAGYRRITTTRMNHIWQRGDG